MKNVLTAAAVLPLLLAAAPAGANLKYYPDPVYKKLAPDDHMPMQDMIDLAEDGDTRAMFILGDMYEKGKGGFPRDDAEARRWFEDAAMHDYAQSFIRLAAMAKRQKKPAEAWQWYTLAINSLDNDDTQDYAVQARKKLVETAGLDNAALKAARSAMGEWKDSRNKLLREERDKATREKRAAEEERPKQGKLKEQDQKKEKENEQN